MKYLLRPLQLIAQNRFEHLSFLRIAPKRLQKFVGKQSSVSSNFKTRRKLYSTVASGDADANSLNKLTPSRFIDILKAENIKRCFILNLEDGVKYSHDVLKEVLPEASLRELEFDHEAIFFDRGLRTDCLMSVFLWRTQRGQGTGGVDLRQKKSMAELIQHGCSFSKTLGIKCALAGLWAGGGKGIVVAPDVGHQYLNPEFRSQVFMDFGDFLSSLNGCMIGGSGIGSSTQDMDEMFCRTRYVSNISTLYGGSANAHYYTGLGVVKAMEAAIDYLEMGTLEGKTVAIQGAGKVGEVVIDELLQLGARHIYVAECNSMRADDIRDTFAQKADGRLTIDKVSFEDTSIFSKSCDIFSPCARAKGPLPESQVLDKNTIPLLDTKIVCGSSSLPVITENDHKLLMDNKILYVTDVVPNRMGIVSKILEPHGRLENDPELNKHLSVYWEHSIYQTTMRILRYSAEHDIHPERAAFLLGEELSQEMNPQFPGRNQAIIRGLVTSGWHRDNDFWKQEDMGFLGSSDF